MFQSLAANSTGQTVLGMPTPVRERLASLGLAGHLLVTDARGGNFSRLTTEPDELAGNFATAANNLGVAGFGLPRKIVKTEEPIQPFQGVGVSGGDENPNDECQGLSARAEQLVDGRVGLGLAYADAQQDFVLDVTTGNVVSVAGHWPMLGSRPYDAAVYALREMNLHLRQEDLYAFGCATARHNFPVDRKGLNLLGGVDTWATGICTDLIGECVEDPADRTRAWDFDLGRFTYAQLQAADIPPTHIYWDTRNTVTDATLPSKRRDDAAGIPYRSGLFAFSLTAI